MTSHKITYTLIISVTFLLISSCSSIHRFTRVKKRPREYSLNYSVEEMKAHKTDLNREPWVVYSDREKNQTYNNAGGKVESKNIDFLDPFLVIRQKGEHLKLIKYTPEIIKNGKLDYKKAELYGWISKSKLLLNQQSVTDITTGKKNKMLTLLTDTVPINSPASFFVPDSIKLYKGSDLKTEVGTVAPYTIIYQMKQSEDKKRVLISKKPYIKAEEAKDNILGWIDNSLVKEIGTGLHINLQTLSSSTNNFSLNRGEKISTTESTIEESQLLATRYKTIKYNSLRSYSVKDSLVAFRTSMTMPVFDYSNNYIFNVNGTQISHKQYREIAKDLKKINISFIFERGEQTSAQFPELVNALQNLQPLFEEPNDTYSFKFNSILDFNNSPQISTPFTESYSELINFLSDKVNSVEEITSPEREREIERESRPWAGLRRAVDITNKHRESTNLLVLIGEKRTTPTGLDSTLIANLLDNNCRIIGFQLFGGKGDDYNNFVLDIEQMINSYANGMLTTKRKVFVSPEQIKRRNQYTRTGEEKNGYRLDFPNSGVTQGALFFPKKDELLPMEIITHNIDTIIQQIKEDNSSITQYMAESFRSTGNNRTQFDRLFAQHYGIDAAQTPDKELITSFKNEILGWSTPSKIVVLTDSLNKIQDYHLLLSEIEQKELKEFIEALSEEEVEFIELSAQEEINNKEAKRGRRSYDDIYDDLFAELEMEKTAAEIEDSIVETDIEDVDTLTIGAYSKTKKIRKHLIKTILTPIKESSFKREKKRILKQLNLAQSQYKITGCPTTNEMLNSIKIGELKDRDIVTDEMLETLIDYYKKMGKELGKAEQFESNGEVYYWLGRELLP